MKATISAAIAALALTAGLVAHEGAEHITGTVKSIDAKALTVETQKHEMVNVLFRPNTEVMKSKAKGKIADLKVGDRVVVHAEKNKAGQYEAEEVEFGAAPVKAK